MPGRLLRTLAGFVSAGVALATGHLVAALFNPATSPATPIPAGAQVPGNTPFTTSIDDFYRVDITMTCVSNEVGGSCVGTAQGITHGRADGLTHG